VNNLHTCIHLLEILEKVVQGRWQCQWLLCDVRTDGRQQVRSDDDEVPKDDSSWVRVARGRGHHLGSNDEVRGGGGGGGRRKVDGFAITSHNCSDDGWLRSMAEIQVLLFLSSL